MIIQGSKGRQSQNRHQDIQDVTGERRELPILDASAAPRSVQEAQLPSVPKRKTFKLAGKTAEIVLGLLGITVLLLLWEVSSQLGWVSPRAVPPPSDVAMTALELLARNDFWVALWNTIWATVVGVAVMIAIAVPLSIAIHSSRVVEESTWFIIEFLKPIPGVALIPLALLVWGPTDGIKVALIVFGGVWPLLTQLVYGLRETSGVALNMVKVYQFSAWQRFRYLTMPSLMPFALTGLRISVTLALIIAIVTEYIVGINGLGLLLSMAQLNGLIQQTYALLFFSGVLGLLASGLIAALSGPLLFWHPSQREKRGK